MGDLRNFRRQSWNAANRGDCVATPEIARILRSTIEPEAGGRELLTLLGDEVPPAVRSALDCVRRFGDKKAFAELFYEVRATYRLPPKGEDHVRTAV